MKKYFSTIIIIIFAFQIHAQTPVIMRHSSGVAIPYYTTNLQEVMSGVVDGDTVYLPGGVYPGFLVDKKVAIYGAGYHPDSTLATQPTQISSIVTLSPGSAGSSLSGLRMQADNFISVQDSNMAISRCYLNNASTGKNGTFYNNVVRGKSFGAGEGSMVFNNIITVKETSFIFSVGFNAANCHFKNNVINISSAGGFNVNVNTCTFENNFIQYYNSSKFFNSLFLNNIFASNVNMPDGTNNGASNLPSQSASNTFINFNTDNYSFFHDFHLIPSSPGINAGTDGKDIGIYGGPYIWKDGALPSNPHISEKIIPFALSPDGTLPIQIKVTAQNN